MMNDIRFAFIFLCIIATSVYGQNPILRVAVARYEPPYAMQAGENQIYGFDVSMMQFICEQIKHDCQFQIMNFEDLLPSLTQDKADVAIGGITITPKRSEQVYFSRPYLVSKARFIGKKSQVNHKMFTLSDLHEKRIGTEKGTVFASEISLMGVRNPKFFEYRSEEKMIEALVDGKIDFALVDEPAALFWQNRTNGLLKALGTSILYGHGMGIAVQPNHSDLLTRINQVIPEYLSSDRHQKHKQLYLQIPIAQHE